MKINYLCFFGVLIITLLNSCLVSKKVIYLEDMVLGESYNMTPIPEIKIQKFDRISVTVGSKTPELAAPFNESNGLYSVNEKGDLLNVGSGNTTNKGYLVDNQGNIEFPILGSLYVENLTVKEIKELIQNRLRDEKLINSASVKVELINLKIMMMGEVAGIGIIDVPDGNINLLEAITRVGGLTNNALVNEIAVIREENGVRKIYYNDIQKVDLFNSPTFHLKQNDIVYVKPKSAVTTPREDMSWRYISMTTGLVTLAFTIFALFQK